MVPVQLPQSTSLPQIQGPTASGACSISDEGGRLHDLAAKHAAEVASLREAFQARLAALEEELQVRFCLAR